MSVDISNLFNLTGKTALVTGASSGLGRQFCRVLAKAGAKVIGVGRNTSNLKSLKLEIEMEGGEFEFFIVDITNTLILKL